MKVLMVGETYYVHETHIKGVDTFVQARYINESDILGDALQAGGIEVDHLPAHKVPDTFPFRLEDLRAYDCVVISDVGAKSFLLSTQTSVNSRIVPNRLEMLEEYVRQGGGVCMVGGYMSFAGIEGKANYAGTPMEALLPVTIQPCDDRREAPQGLDIRITAPDHPVFAGVSTAWPKFLGYNRIQAKPGTELATCGQDTFIAAWEYGQGRALAFASDCAPHWAPPEFVHWEYYGRFWCNVARYLAKAA